jgi:hypothetical protein
MSGISASSSSVLWRFAYGLMINYVRILVYSEDYCFQDAIDALSDLAMRKFNKLRAIVFAILFMYLHDCMPYLRRIFDDAVAKGYIACV